MLNPDFRDLLSAFIDAHVEFLIVGGYALAVHRLPRATKGPGRNKVAKFWASRRPPGKARGARIPGVC